MLRKLTTISHLLNHLHKTPRINNNPISYKFTQKSSQNTIIQTQKNSPNTQTQQYNNQSNQINQNNQQKTIRKQNIYKKLSQRQNIKAIDIRIKSKLIQRLNKLNIKPRKSMFIQQFLQQEHNQIQFQQYQQLSKFNKQKLGLYIPDPPFPARMTKYHQQQYRKQLCQNLYDLQQSRFDVTARILELSGNRNQIKQNQQFNKCTIQQYTNLVYKDIFARYLVNKGVGVQWLGKHNMYGVMNPSQLKQINKQFQSIKFLKWFYTFMCHYQPKISQSLYLYSYSTHRYIPFSSQRVQIQDIYKIGHYITLPLTKFGMYEADFNQIIERQEQINLLVFVDEIIKVIDPKALILQQGKFIILKRYVQKKQNSDTEEQDFNQQIGFKKASYLITSMQIYSENRQYFVKQGYEKHSIFHSKHMTGMQASIKKYSNASNNERLNLQILPQIQGYHRKQGIYLCDSQTNLGDRQRASAYKLINQQDPNIIDFSGKIIIDYKPTNIQINDPMYQQKLIQKLNIEIFPLHGTYQDQIYSYFHENSEKYQKLHFRRINRLNIPIPQNNCNQLVQILWGTQQSQYHPIISESKVEVPRLKPYYHKKRDKRHHKKQIKYMKQQQTPYMSLQQSLQSVEWIPLDKVADDIDAQQSTKINLPIIILQHKITKIQQILPLSEQITNILMQKIEVQNTALNWNEQQIKTHVSHYLQESGFKFSDQYQLLVRSVWLSNQILKGWECLKDCIQPQKQKLSNIIIEPQSKTQDTIPYFFHMFYMTKKIIQNQINKNRRGRRTVNSQQQPLQFAKLFSIIKLHPTIDQSQSNRSIDELLFGVLKLNNKSQYGYGLEAFRLWILKRDNYKGDRKIIEKQINQQIKLTSFIRKLYWDILPLLDAGQFQANSNTVTKKEYLYDQMTYLHRFMADHINYYIYNMQNTLKSLDLSSAHQLTKDFLQNYVHEIFVKTVRHRIITYPNNHQQNTQSKQILKRIISLLPILQPLIPYSTYHITKQPLMPWPIINLNHQDNQDNTIYKLRPQLVPKYNKMIRLRVQIRNKLLLNKMQHSQLVINNEQIPEYNLSDEDLQLFFNLSNISIGQPTENTKKFRLKLKKQHPLGQQVQKIEFYEYNDVCFRCSPQYFRKINERRIKKGLMPQNKYLCSRCLGYLNSNVDKLLPI